MFEVENFKTKQIDLGGEDVKFFQISFKLGEGGPTFIKNRKLVSVELAQDFLFTTPVLNDIVKGVFVNFFKTNAKGVELSTCFQVPGFSSEEENGIFILDPGTELLITNGKRVTKNFFKVLAENKKNYLIVKYTPAIAAKPSQESK